jgi:hypothetical protein
MKRAYSNHRLQSLTGLAAGLMLMTAFTSVPAKCQAVLSPDKLLIKCVDGHCTPASTTLTNVGSASITLQSITVSGGVAETNNCGAMLKPGGSCVFSLTVTPSGPGKFSGTLTVNDSAPNSPQTCLLEVIAKGQGS